VATTTPEPKPSPKRERAPKRKSISLKGITYQRLKDYCGATGKSVSGYLEDLIEDDLDRRLPPDPADAAESAAADVYGGSAE
jgi:hypothetical protein